MLRSLSQPQREPQDAGAVPLDKLAVAKFGRFYSDATYGTEYAWFPKGDGGLFTVLGGVDAIIDETFYVGVPGLKNVSASLGFGSVAAARSSLQAFENGDVFRWDGEQSPTGSSGWLEMAVARPDWVLMDLARAFTPAVLSDALNITNNIANKGPAGTVRGFGGGGGVSVAR